MLKLMNKELSGDLWEVICDSCYRIRYQDEGYQKVPPTHKGDFGVEGYTHSGIVYQCYYPEKEYTDDELYKKQRIKMTQDINKLISNGEGLKSIGIVNVKEWHFVVPEYRDKRILKHRTDKKKVVIDAKNNNGLDYIDKDFNILIKTEEDFFQEINTLINLENNFKYDFSYRHTGEINWSDCQSEKVDNIKRKLKAIMTSKGNDLDEDRFNRLISIYVSYYTKGIEILNQLRISNPELYESITNISHTFKIEAQVKCDMNLDRSINGELFNEILKDFEVKLSQAFGKIMTITSVAELKNDLVSGWLADCPMDFR
ncbi:hypothetical protein PP175_03920 [Aneurinibacillus sp. Ricciae_BoGa-3]|uniref:hypothetical protein n=1 Tax=Aneurinibacillus sp. Ricciae_BoGa-3 TaxID=3022697 RepID=UPI00234193D9|nr:hypothetical protein [Aneurinibacillus sp. Ricciae_BoGa-3]WCK55144.1 hypothetical protein PP175_03920 [Aneurinibacillus sp. Ricciae_BoGa-3]